MKPIKLVATAVSAMMLLAGCTNGGSEPAPSTSVVEVTVTADPTPAPSPTNAPPTESASATSAPATSAPPTEPAPAGPYGTAPTQYEPAQPGHEYQITDIRVGSHAGYDRVVIELLGGAVDQVGWLAEYDPNPMTQGRGDAVELPGDATLRVIVRGLLVPPTEPILQGVLDGSAHGQITGVYADPVFEGQAVVFIGLPAQSGYQISTLDSPARIVIDIQHS